MKKEKKLYQIDQITLIRSKEDNTKDFSFKSDDIITDVAMFKKHLKDKYGASKVHLTFTEVPAEKEEGNG